MGSSTCVPSTNWTRGRWPARSRCRRLNLSFHRMASGSPFSRTVTVHWRKSPLAAGRLWSGRRPASPTAPVGEKTTRSCMPRKGKESSASPPTGGSLSCSSPSMPPLAPNSRNCFPEDGPFCTRDVSRGRVRLPQPGTRRRSSLKIWPPGSGPLSWMAARMPDTCRPDIWFTRWGTDCWPCRSTRHGMRWLVPLCCSWRVSVAPVSMVQPMRTCRGRAHWCTWRVRWRVPVDSSGWTTQAARR